MSQSTGQANADPELIVRNARITTLDPALPAATAVAITGGTVSAVGEDRDVMARPGQVRASSTP